MTTIEEITGFIQHQPMQYTEEKNLSLLRMLSFFFYFSLLGKRESRLDPIYFSFHFLHSSIVFLSSLHRSHTHHLVSCHGTTMRFPCFLML